MDFISLYYFSELAKDLNMTKTANRLYISQQTLSNHIQRLESYYDTPLFDRKPALRLTSAGEFVLAFAQDVGRGENDLKDILADINRQERGILRIGASTARGNQILPHILPDFFQRYPKVECRYVAGLAAEQERMVANGSLDLGIVLPGDYGPELFAQELLQDHVYFCAANSLLREYYSDTELFAIKEKAKTGVQVKDIARVPFSMMSNRLGRQIRNLFLRDGITPTVYFTCQGSAQAIPLCVRGVTACFCTHMALADNSDILGKQINVFPLLDQDIPVTQTLSLLRYRQRYLPHYFKYFIELLTKFCENQEMLHISRIVSDTADQADESPPIPKRNAES